MNAPRLSRFASLLIAAVFASAPVLRAAPNILLWDTGMKLGKAPGMPDKENWRIVPTDLFKLEKDPLKSSSDPGYYGREYAFTGDMVVENRHLTAVFVSTEGRVHLYAKRIGSPAPSSESDLGEKIGEVAVLRSPGAGIKKINLLRNSGDEVAAEFLFSGGGSAEPPVSVEFGKTEIIEINAPQGSGLSLRAPVEYGIVPSFVGDDLVFGSDQDAEANTLTVPAENFLLALLSGEQHQVVCSWPSGKQRVNLQLGPQNDGKRAINSINFETDGKPLFIAPQSAPGIWHREQLGSRYLEKVVASDWQRPFPARWQTQLNETGVKARYTFRQEAGTVWRGVPGSYNYPVWFEGEKAFYHLSKKVPPKGESIIYFLEGQETPPEILTPVEILKATLGRLETDAILDLSGRKLRTHHRRGGEGVRRACTCGCTEAIQAIFEAGEETTRKQEIQEEIDDMIYFVKCHVDRIEEYQRFAADMQKFLKSQAHTSADLKPYIETLWDILLEIPQKYEIQKENMKSLDHVHELERRTMQLTEKKDSKNLAAYMELLKAWRGMGGAQDEVVAQCHVSTRKLFHEASYTAATLPKALDLAYEIRSRCREILRNADGYEIWPDY
jgi:hypothetical protein